MADKGAFTGKRALVIGGSGGIGRFVSQALAAAGAAVTATGASKQHLDRLVAEADITPLQLSLDTDDAAAGLLSLCPATDILVCAWGPFLRKPLAETTAEDWRRIVTLNLILPGSLVSAYLGGMMERRWGRILLFGGTNTAFIRGWTTTAPYASAKTALGALAKSVAKNAASLGVTCNVICPGLTDTEYLDETARAYNRDNSPTGRAMQSQDIAAFAVDILANPCLNGAILPIDCGVDVQVV